MENVTWQVKQFGSSIKVAVLVCGFGGTIQQFLRAITELTNHGYMVIAYQYDRTVFSGGDPTRSLGLINDIYTDVSARTHSASELLFTGVSLGAFVAFNLQRKHLPQKSFGIYGTSGVALSHCMFHARAFRGAKNDFIAAGYDEASLHNAWKSVEIIAGETPPHNMPILCVNGTADKVVHYDEAMKNLRSWEHDGYPVQTHTIRGIGHVLGIEWYKRNMGKMLTWAKR